MEGEVALAGREHRDMAFLGDEMGDRIAVEREDAPPARPGRAQGVEEIDDVEAIAGGEDEETVEERGTGLDLDGVCLLVERPTVVSVEHEDPSGGVDADPERSQLKGRGGQGRVERHPPGDLGPIDVDGRELAVEASLVGALGVRERPAAPAADAPEPSIVGPAPWTCLVQACPGLEWTLSH
jgi:hypothetical protein